MPVFKTPFHLSYLIYLSRFSLLVMSIYLKLSIFMCRITRTRPIFLLHPLDLLGKEHAPELEFFPGMEISALKKIEIFDRVLRFLQKYYDLKTLNNFAISTLQQNSGKDGQILYNPIIKQFNCDRP